MSSDYNPSNTPRTPENRDLLVPPGSHAFVQYQTTGEVRVIVGPRVQTFSGQERPVRFDEETDSFASCTQDQSLRKNIHVKEGYYVILENPCFTAAGGNHHPTVDSNQNNNSSTLSLGRRVIIRGPVDFALWPRQKARVVAGHSLKSNQYLEATVYDPESARKNWSAAIATAATQSPSNPAENKDGGANTNPETKTDPAKTAENKTAITAEPPALVMGQRLIIKGAEISFYIPPTGVQVLEENKNYVREAVTLERLEYCVLVDENGNKRFEAGPAVVFPRPTEQFFTRDNARKFRAIELPEKSGIHVKVIADYKEESEEGTSKRVESYTTGSELFITGERQPIYYPREEHSIIKYGDGSLVHYGVAIPKGEGRYVMNKITGDIRTEIGPNILLCDPRKEVICRRILTDNQCQDWYPLNNEALNYNRSLRQMQEVSGSARSDIVEDSVTRGLSNARRSGLLTKSASYVAPAAGAEVMNYGSFESYEQVGAGAASDEFSRSPRFTPPRSLTLNTKYEGVPTIDVWTGYAVMVVDKSGGRSIKEGPTTALLGYDESLEIMTLSTGKPKNTEKLYRTVYLRTQNNKVSDIVEVETSDHVRCQVKLSFCVNFDSECKQDWFNTENYVKLLCDHVRSVLKGVAKKWTIEDFYQNATQLIRDLILGQKPAAGPDGKPSTRGGMFFPNNGMRIVDVEILSNEIQDRNIAEMLVGAQQSAVASNVRLANARRQLTITKEEERIKMETLTATVGTAQHEAKLELLKIADQLSIAMKRSDSEFQKIAEQRKIKEAQLEIETLENDIRLKNELAEHTQENDLEKDRQSLANERLEKETTAVIERFKAAGGSFTETLAFLSREDNAIKIAQACSFQTTIGGKSIAEAVANIFGPDSPIAARLREVFAKGGSMVARQEA